MDVMIDIETLGTGLDATVIQLAAARFDINGVGETFTTPLNPQGQISKGRTWDFDTLLFWVQQPSCYQVWSEAVNADHNTKAVLQRFAEWYQAAPVEHVWAKPPTFDLMILEQVYRMYSVRVPWDHRAPRDVRTLMSLVPASCYVRRGTHIALEDVKDQCQSVINALTYLKGVSHE